MIRCSHVCHYHCQCQCHCHCHCQIEDSQTQTHFRKICLYRVNHIGFEFLLPLLIILLSFDTLTSITHSYAAFPPRSHQGTIIESMKQYDHYAADLDTAAAAAALPASPVHSVRSEVQLMRRSSTSSDSEIEFWTIPIVPYSSSKFALEFGDQFEQLELSIMPNQIEEMGNATIFVHGIGSKYSQDPWKINLDDEMTSKDFIGISCGFMNGPADFLDEIPLSISMNAGSVLQATAQRLVSLRCDWNFTYVHVVNGIGHALAWISAPMRLSQSLPKQVHLAFGDSHDTMWISWVSNSNYNDYPPTVKYGTQSDSYTQRSTGRTSAYAASDMCGAPANVTAQKWFRDPGYLHDVLVTNLTIDPNNPTIGQRYYYRVGNDVDGWSEEFSFLSSVPPMPLDSPEVVNATVSFLVLGDQGVDEDMPGAAITARRSAEAIRTGEVNSFALHFGDVAYGVGVGWRWDAYGTLMQNVMARVPYMVSIGNHEYDHNYDDRHKDPSGATGIGFRPSWGDYGNDSNSECGVPLYRRYRAPSNGNSVFWYSFDYSFVHVVMLSSEHSYLIGSPQRDWLEADLKRVNRTLTAFIVVTFHRQMYTSQLPMRTERRMAERMQKELGQLFLISGVSIVFNGHQHSYERTCAVYLSDCIPSGRAPVYVVMGTAGASLENTGFDDSGASPWAVARTQQFGIGIILASYQQMTIKFKLDSNETVWDEVQLQPYDGEKTWKDIQSGEAFRDAKLDGIAADADYLYRDQLVNE